MIWILVLVPQIDSRDEEKCGEYDTNAAPDQEDLKKFQGGLKWTSPYSDFVLDYSEIATSFICLR